MRERHALNIAFEVDKVYFTFQVPIPASHEYGSISTPSTRLDIAATLVGV
jgi:hypothetical protein